MTASQLHLTKTKHPLKPPYLALTTPDFPLSLTQTPFMAAASAVWFITDISSAFGAQIALEALSSGQRVIGTVSRDRREIKAAERVSVVEAGGGKVLRLDVTDAGACAAVWKEAESLYGRVDVLVNSSGDSLLGAVEDLGWVILRRGGCPFAVPLPVNFFFVSFTLRQYSFFIVEMTKPEPRWRPIFSVPSA